jgi:hypothetical protein
VPDQAKTSIVAEYFCSFGDEVWGSSDEALVERTAQHLAADLGFIAPREVLGGFAVRAPRAYPSYTLGYQDALAVLKGFVDSFANLQIIGRYGTFRYNNADHSVETGLLAAKNILGERHDLDRVNAEREYLEIKRLDKRADSVVVNGRSTPLPRDTARTTAVSGEEVAATVPVTLAELPAAEVQTAPADD